VFKPQDAEIAKEPYMTPRFLGDLNKILVDLVFGGEKTIA